MSSGRDVGLKRRNLRPKPVNVQCRWYETIIGQIKEFSSLNQHRSVINAFVHIIAAITAYQMALSTWHRLRLVRTTFRPRRRPEAHKPISRMTSEWVRIARIKVA
jgi:hypothetical protein